MTSRVTSSELFDEWTTYKKVVASDYMHHQDFFAALAQEIGTCLQAPLSIVDLGCGDCVSVVSFQNYTVLEPQEMEELLDHVCANDFPETLASYRKLGNAAGFVQVSPVAQDAERLNRLLILS